MAKNSKRTRSKYTEEALKLFGGLIRAGRIERDWSTQELADRLDCARASVLRIEDGHPGCEIGMVFEAAALVGIKLFDADLMCLTELRGQVESKIALLPKAVRKSTNKVNDDF